MNLMYTKINFDIDDISKQIIDHNLIPKQIIRNYQQTAILADNKAEIPHETFNFLLKPNQIKPYHLHAYLNNGGGGNSVIQAIIKSLDIDYSYAEHFEGIKNGIPIVWGVLRNSKHIINEAKLGHYFYYIDHAYFCRGHKKPIE